MSVLRFSLLFSPFFLSFTSQQSIHNNLSHSIILLLRPLIFPHFLLLSFCFISIFLYVHLFSLFFLFIIFVSRNLPLRVLSLYVSLCFFIHLIPLWNDAFQQFSYLALFLSFQQFSYLTSNICFGTICQIWKCSKTK